MADVDSKKDLATKALYAGAAATTGLAATRAYHQINMSPNIIDVVGGTTGVSGQGSLEFQRDSWINALEADGKTDVRGYASRLGYNREGGKHLISANNLKKNKSMNTLIPATELHVSRYDGNPLSLLAKRVLTGKNYYRVLTDMGPGGLEQKSSGGWNMMKAHKGPIYDRLVVPGGDVLKTPKARRDNINVTSIPVPEHFNQKYEAPIRKSGRVEVMLNAGGGSGWPGILPGPSEKELEGYTKPMLKTKYKHVTDPKVIEKLRINLENEYIDIVNKKQLQTNTDALDKAFGKGRYNLNILSGPSAPDKYKKLFKEHAAVNPRVKFVEAVSRKDMGHFMAKHDLVMMPTGSTIAEIAAMEGYKPKVLAITPRASESFGNHFSHNTEWYKKEFGGIQRVDIDKGEYTADVLSQRLRDLHAGDRAKTHAARFSAADTERVLNTIKEDFTRSKKLTRNMFIAGGALATAGAIKHLVDKKKIKTHKAPLAPAEPSQIKVASLENKGIELLKTFKGGKTRYIAIGAATGGLVGYGTKKVTDTDGVLVPLSGAVVGAAAGAAVGKNLKAILIAKSGNRAEGRRLFAEVKEYPSGVNILKNIIMP